MIISPSAITLSLAIAFTAYAVAHAPSVKLQIKATLESLATSILPSLLPFMMASGILSRSGFGAICERLFSGIFGKLFKLNGSIASAFILGSVSGFPIGGKTLCSLYQHGECSKQEAERALPLCSLPGFGFTVAGIGASMLGSVSAGFRIWLTCLLSAIITGILVTPKDAVVPTNFSLNASKTASSQSEIAFSAIITETVSETTISALRVCGFVLFFKTASEFFSGFTALFVASSQLSETVSSAFFEFSSGAIMLSRIEIPPLTIGSLRLSICSLREALIAAALSWSGVSVHFQTASFAISSKLSMKKYYPSKLLSCALSLLLSLGFTASSVFFT